MDEKLSDSLNTELVSEVSLEVWLSVSSVDEPVDSSLLDDD